MYMLILPTILFQLKDQFGLSIAQITFLGTICYFLYGVIALPGGFLADKSGYRIVLTVFFLGTPAAACVVGAARSVLSLGIGLALLGLFASLYHPAGLAMISHEVRERGRALGLNGISGNFGLALSPIIAGSIAVSLSWRYAFYLLSIPGFIVGAAFIIVSRTVLKTAQSGARASENVRQDAAPEPAERLSISALILLYAAMTLAGFLYSGTMAMLPSYLGRISMDSRFQTDLEGLNLSEDLRQELGNEKLPLSEHAAISSIQEHRKWQIKDADGKKYEVRREGNRLNIYGRHAAKGGLFTTMVLLVGMLGQYAGGYFSDRRRKTWLYLLINFMSLPFMILIGLTSGMLVVTVAAGFALFHFAGQPVENNLIAHYTPPRLRSSSYGLKFLLTFGIGSFATGFAGYVADNFGFDSVFLALGVVILLIVLIVLLLSMVAREVRVEASQ